MAQIFSQVFQLGLGQNEIVVAVHEKKRGLVQFRIGELQSPFFLDLERGGARNEFHQVLTDVAAIVSVVRTVANAPHEESGLLVIDGLGGSGEGGEEKNVKGEEGKETVESLNR